MNNGKPPDEKNPLMAMIWGMAATLGQLSSQIDEYAERIAHSDSIGPILDPTLWRDNHKKFDEDKRIFETARNMRDVFLKIKSENEIIKHD